MYYGNLFIIAAPSGAGKTTLVKALASSVSNVALSVSHTTRSPRSGEEEGKHYFFVQSEEFQNMIDAGDFLEYARVFGCFYGTTRKFVEQVRQQGIDVILEIDWQGMEQIKAILPDSISIFILPPSLANLKERLINRNQDSTQVIADRLADAQDTIAHVKNFDFVVLNENFNNALLDLKLILQASRLRQSYQLAKHAQLIKDWCTLDKS